MSYMNFMEPEAVTQHTRNPSLNKSKFFKEQLYLLAIKIGKIHRKIFHTGLNLYYISKATVIDNASSKHALKQALNFVSFSQEVKQN